MVLGAVMRLARADAFHVEAFQRLDDLGRIEGPGLLDRVGVEQRLDVGGVGRLRGRGAVFLLEGLDEDLRARIVQLLVELRRPQHADRKSTRLNSSTYCASRMPPPP